MNIRKKFKKVLPISYFKMECLFRELLNNNEKNQQELQGYFNILNEEIFNISHRLDLLQNRQNELLALDIPNRTNIPFEKRFGDELSQELMSMRCDVSKIEHELCSLKDIIKKDNSTFIKLQKENLWSAIFNNAINGCVWLTDQAFTPGRWAMGYPALYILYSVLEQFNPQHILELGLGQSTKMITQYAAQNKTIEHFVVEHDNAWIDFFKKNNLVSSNTIIICLDRELVSFKDAEEVRVFKNFKSTFGLYKFDLIIIDAPLGGDMKKYSRIDVLSLIKANLCEQFVMILDDVNRVAERNTMYEISRHLSQANIEYTQKIYEGEKETCIWTTPQWSFLCSL